MTGLFIGMTASHVRRCPMYIPMSYVDFEECPKSCYLFVFSCRIVAFKKKLRARVEFKGQ